MSAEDELELQFNEELETHTEQTVKLCLLYAHTVLLDFTKWLGVRSPTIALVDEYMRTMR